MLVKLTPSRSRRVRRHLARRIRRHARQPTGRELPAKLSDYGPRYGLRRQDDCPDPALPPPHLVESFFERRLSTHPYDEALPEAHDPVLVECFVDAHDGEAAFEGLGSEQAIKRIAVVKRQRGDTGDVRYLDGEQFESGVGQSGGSNSPRGFARANLPRLALIAISHALATLNARTPPAPSIASRARLLIRSLPSMNHRKA